MRQIPDGMLSRHGRTEPIASFWLDERAVTVAEYKACADAGACKQPESGKDCSWGKPGKENETVNCVNYGQAAAYCEWANVRLPTEAEWEWAVKNAKEAGVSASKEGFSEWLSTYYCSPDIGGCGHARMLGETPIREDMRLLPVYSTAWVGFRCAWSSRPPAQQEEPPAQPPEASTTPGKIRCGTAMCDLQAEACCELQRDGVGRCIPKTESSCKGEELRVACDESADCAPGDGCCRSVGCSYGCAEEWTCQKGGCQAGDEVCLPGGACARGYGCAAEAAHGWCRWKDVGASCGGKRCSGATPVCCWDSSKKSGTCVADECGSFKELRLACTVPKDCGGISCTSGRFMGDPDKEKDPGFNCSTLGPLSSEILCGEPADCTTHPVSGASPKGCRHFANLPPGVKACAY